MAQEHKSKASSRTEQGTVADAAPTASAVDTSETDALLDEIDEVLESNAEQFVKGYIQKGGE